MSDRRVSARGAFTDVTGVTKKAEFLVRLLSGRWTLAILGELVSGGRRYRELHDALEGVSHKVLTETLRRAERDGLIGRYLNSDRIETTTLYDLTDLGRSLEEPLAGLGQWIDAHWDDVEVAHRRWDARQKAS
jgi:DNA-binding HxlR family transcriptional regulator